jgi:AraC-like DNA-binding protein
MPSAQAERAIADLRAAMHKAALEVQAQRVERAKQFIAEHFLRNPGFGEVAAHVGLSAFHFHRVFTQTTGVSPKDYVDNLRIEEAKRRMLAGEPLASIATSLNYAHQSHFTSRFKKITGDPPRRWRIRNWLTQRAA